ncbi:MAG: enolase C-terminal domain-like protein [Alphaproteobacteria bacterium]
MRILDIRESTEKIQSMMRNAVIDFSKMTTSVVALITDQTRNGKPVIGYGCGSNGRYAQGSILRERLIPRILEAEPDSLLDESGLFDPFKIQSAMMKNEKPGGHGDRAVAAAVIDMAVWDALAKLEEKPLWRLLSERYNNGEFDKKVLVYPGGGYYYDDKEIEGLKAEMAQYQRLGYRILKMKIGGADLKTDLKRIDAVLDLVGSGQNLAVDANGKFDLEQAVTFGKAIEPLDLFWYEEPGDPLDFALHKALANQYTNPIATAENLFSRQDVTNFALYGGLRPEKDWIQMDPALGYGLSEYLQTMEAIGTLGWTRRQQIPHGGHQLGLHMAAGLQLGGTESYPLVFQPFGGFADDAVIEDGYTAPPDVPGIGIELKSKMYNILNKISE